MNNWHDFNDITTLKEGEYVIVRATWEDLHQTSYATAKMFYRELLVRASCEHLCSKGWAKRHWHSIDADSPQWSPLCNIDVNNIRYMSPILVRYKYTLDDNWQYTICYRCGDNDLTLESYERNNAEWMMLEDNINTL